jgi:hypothetical protein
MVSCCVNPACRAEFRSLNTGDIYAVERRSADTEFFGSAPPACQWSTRRGASLWDRDVMLDICSDLIRIAV